MLDKDRNKLDDLFRGKLRNNADASNKWNVPPKSVLENALSAMEADEPEKKRKWPVVFLFGIGLTMFLSIGYLFHQNQTMMKELDEKISIINKVQQQQNKIASAGADRVISSEAVTPAVENIQIQKTNATTNIVAATTKTQSGNNNSNNNNKAVNNNIISKSNNQSITASTIKSASSGRTVIINSDAVPTTDRTATTINNDHSNNNIVTTPSPSPIALNNNVNSTYVVVDEIPTLKIVLTENFESVLPFTLVAAAESAEYTAEKGSSKFAPFLLAGGQKPFFQSLDDNTKGIMSEVTSHGVQFGLGTTYRLSKKWFLESSLAYQRFNVNSSFQEEMIYDENLEFTNANGEMLYNMDVSGRTPTHETYQKLTIPIDSGVWEDGDIMLANTKTSSKFNIYSLHLGAGYLVGQLGKFDLIANGGLSANWTSAIKDEMNFSFMHDGVMRIAAYRSDEKGLDDFFASAYLGGQLNYRISNQFHIGLNTNFNKGFSNPNLNTVNNADISKIGTLNSTLRFGFSF